MKLPNVSNDSLKTSVSNNRLYTHIPSYSAWTYVESTLPRHHWKFSEDSDTLTHASDSGSYPNKLKKTGATCAFATTGKIDYAVYIPSTASTINYLVSNYAYAETYDDMTISTWVKFMGLSNSSSPNYIYNRSNTYLHLYQTAIRGGGYTTTFTFQYGTGVVFTFTTPTHPLSGTSWYGVNTTDWFLFTNTVNTDNSGNKVFKMYINSLYITGSTISSESPASFTSTDYHYVGSDNTPIANQSLNGYLCDLRIYNRAISQQEVSILYNVGRGTYQQSIATTFPTSLPPVAHLKLQERSTNGEFSDSGTRPGVWFASGVMAPSGVTNNTTQTNGVYCYYNSANNDLTGTTYICSYSNQSYSLWYKKIGATGNTYILRTASNGSINLETLDGKFDLRVHVYNTYVDIVAGLSSWIHIIVTLNNDSSTYKIYIGGEYVTENTWSSGLCVNEFKLLNSNCVGYVQDFRAYPYTLNATEVRNLYNEGLGLLI